MPSITIPFEISNINFCWYGRDRIYVQFDELPFIGIDEEHEATILAAVNEALGGKVTATGLTDDDAYCQASIGEELTLEQLQALGWPVSNES
jgi:hypothetical protein